MKTSAPNTTKLPLVPNPTGGLLQPLEPAAAPRLTRFGLKCSDETLICLLATCLGLMREMLSGDAMFLAMERARSEATKMGVDPAEFERVQEIVVRHWEAGRRANPLSGMF